MAEDQQSISYYKADAQRASFTDHGSRVSLAPNTYKEDPNALRAALEHADEKFERFSVRGSREHQEAAARLAERLGMGTKIANADLQEVMRQERELIAKERAQQAQRASGQPQAGAEEHDQTKSATNKAETASDVTSTRESDSTRQGESATQTWVSDSGAQSKAAESESQRAKNEPAKSDKPVTSSASAASTATVAHDLPKPPGYDAYMAAQAKGQKSASKDALSQPPTGKGQEGDGASQSERPASARTR